MRDDGYDSWGFVVFDNGPKGETFGKNEGYATHQECLRQAMRTYDRARVGGFRGACTIQIIKNEELISQYVKEHYG